jgi:hypothetical protein
MLKTKLRIYTTLWGQRYLDLFEKTILRSFSWPKNKEAILKEDYTWSFYTTKEDEDKITRMMTDSGFTNLEFRRIQVPILKPYGDAQAIVGYKEEKIDGNHPHMGLVLLKCFTTEIEECLKQNAKLLLAPPDSIFGDGSIHGILACAKLDHTCVSVPHPRVVDSIFNELKPSTNSELVSQSFKHLHKTWEEANADLPMINSYVGGVQWQKIGEDLYRVNHRLPTPYLLHFKPHDLEFFNQQICFGTIDHIWPTNLFGEERIRYIGSSDIAFIVEVTARCQNIPPRYPTPPNEPDKFWRNAYHNQIYRQVFSVFRGVNG